MNIAFQNLTAANEDDPVGQALHSFLSAADHLMVVTLENRDAMANDAAHEIVCEGIRRARAARTLIEARMIVNT